MAIHLLIWRYDIKVQEAGITTLHPVLLADRPSSVKCRLYDNLLPSNSPSLSSFILATTSGDQDSRLNGLAVYLELTDACQRPEDFSKVKVQMHKVALVTLNDPMRCPFQNLAVKAQNAGYTVLIYFGDILNLNFSSSTHYGRLLIPVLRSEDKECTQTGWYGEKAAVDHKVSNWIDLTNREIGISEVRLPDLIKMQSYLYRLYFWLLVGPIITLEWLRRTKKFCWMSGGQQLNNNGLTDENEAEIRNMEEGGSGTEGSNLHSTNENYRDRDDEEQPLLTTQPTVINDYTRQPRGTGCVNIFRKVSLRKTAVGFLYGILIIAALPVGISFGGLSFFRFDGMYTRRSESVLDIVWPTFQVFCFFMYSQSACKITWTIQTEFSKLIRSDWFASNMYLLVLGVVVP